MIEIKDKTKCCGCTACASICSQKCISMLADEEGFKYPNVNTNLCINCGLCEKVCPYNQTETEDVLNPPSFACLNKNKDIVKNSSSGGVFTLFANEIINKGGCVVGVAFDDRWRTKHVIVDNLNDLWKLRGSKYTQSNLSDIFIQIKNLLKNETQVLFSGTPCQVMGLRRYLRKDYPNLYTIENICHGVASPIVWDEYLKEKLEQLGNNSATINYVTFRDKSFGWSNYGLHVQALDINTGKYYEVIHNSNKNDLFMRGFLNSLFTRPSCANCPARHFKSNGDITIGDCWGVEKYYPDAKIANGLSVVITTTEKGKKLFDDIKDFTEYFEMNFEEVEPNGIHSPLYHSTPSHPNRNHFFTQFKHGSLQRRIYKEIIYGEIRDNIILKAKKIFKLLFGTTVFNYFKKIYHE